MVGGRLVRRGVLLGGAGLVGFTILFTRNSGLGAFAAPEPPPLQSASLAATRLPCGAEALLALLDTARPGAARRVRQQCRTTAPGLGPTASFADLAATARRAGVRLRGYFVSGAGLEGVPLPLIAHLSPGHFVTITCQTAERVTIRAADGAQRDVARREFDRQFTGHVLFLAD